jgi:hypothetical protein
MTIRILVGDLLTQMDIALLGIKDLLTPRDLQCILDIPISLDILIRTDLLARQALQDLQDPEDNPRFLLQTLDLHRPLESRRGGFLRRLGPQVHKADCLGASTCGYLGDGLASPACHTVTAV